MEQNSATDTAEKKPIGLVGKIIKWGIMALLFFTCIMAAYRKFGG